MKTLHLPFRSSCFFLLATTDLVGAGVWPGGKEVVFPGKGGSVSPDKEVVFSPG